MRNVTHWQASTSIRKLAFVLKLLRLHVCRAVGEQAGGIITSLLHLERAIMLSPERSLTFPDVDRVNWLNFLALLATSYPSSLASTNET